MKYFLFFFFIFCSLFAQKLPSNNYLERFTDEEKEYLKNKKTLKVHIEQDWYPFSFHTNNEPDGFIYHLQTIIAHRLGLKLEVKKILFDEAIKSLKSGEIDLILEGDSATFPPPEFVLSNIVLFDYLDTIFGYEKYENIEQLNGKKIGILSGLEKVYSIKEAKEIIEFKSHFDLFSALLNKDIDFAIAEYYSSMHNLSTMMAINKFNMTVFKTKDTYIDPHTKIAVKKENKILIDVIEKILTQKEIMKIRDEWIAKSIDNTIPLSEKENRIIKSTVLNIHTYNYAPFSIKRNDNIIQNGIAFDFWNEINSKLDFEFKVIEHTNIDELYKALSNDPNGIALTNFNTQTKNRQTLQSNPYVSFPFVIAGQEDHSYILSFNQLVGKTIAVSSEYDIHKVLQKKFPNVKLKVVETSHEALKLAANKEVYAAVDILPVLIYDIKKHHFDQIKILGLSKLNQDMKILTNKQLKDVIPIINKSINLLKEEKKQQIIEEWTSKNVFIPYFDYMLYLKIFILLIIIMALLIMLSIYLKNKNKTIENLKNKYQIFIKSSTEGIFIIEPKTGKLVEFSDALCHILGYSSKKLGESFVWEWDQNIKHKKNFFKLIENIKEKTAEFERPILTNSGKSIIAYITVRRINFDDKEYIYGTLKDITEKIELKQIKKLTKDLQISQDIAKLGVSIIDDLSDFNKPIQCNKTYYEIHEYDDKTQLTLNKIIEKISPLDNHKFQKALIEFKIKGKTLIEGINFTTSKGNQKYADVYWERRKDEVTKKNIIYSVVQDVTARVIREKEIEKQQIAMIKQQRLAQQGEMLEMIGHQWRQPLNNIGIDIQMIKAFGESDPALLQEKADNALSLVFYLSKTVNDFRRFFSNSKKVELFNISDLLKESIMIIKNRIDFNKIEMIGNFNESKYEIISYKSELGQVVLVILNNAIDALEQNKIKNKIISINIEENKNELSIKIEDNAKGITPEVMERVFEPYYSTKSEKNGTGLGLYMSKMIVEKSLKGKIEVSNQNDGALFKIVIPKEL